VPSGECRSSEGHGTYGPDLTRRRASAARPALHLGGVRGLGHSSITPPRHLGAAGFGGPGSVDRDRWARVRWAREGSNLRPEDYESEANRPSNALTCRLTWSGCVRRASDAIAILGVLRSFRATFRDSCAQRNRVLPPLLASISERGQRASLERTVRWTRNRPSGRVDRRPRAHKNEANFCLQETANGTRHALALQSPHSPTGTA
jgi:hypothetical protein